MADKILKSITFPNLPDKYIIPETTVDSIPTQGSTHAVSSGGVYDALQSGVSGLPDVDSTDNGKTLQVVDGGWVVSSGIGDELDELKIFLGSVESLTWAERMAYVRAGKGADLFPVGTQFSTPHGTFGSILWDVVAHDHFANPNNSGAHTMTLMMHYSLSSDNMVYSVNDAVYFAENGLAAGNYSFTVIDRSNAVGGQDNGLTYYFTLANNIPVGGQIRRYALDYNVRYTVENALAVYSSWQATEPTELITLTLTPINGAVSIDINNGGFIDNACPDYDISAIRQWLNSDADEGEWFVPATGYDRVGYSHGKYEVGNKLKDYTTTFAGFMRDIDHDFLSYVGEVAYPCVSGRVSLSRDPFAEYTVLDKFTLPSLNEVGLSKPKDELSCGRNLKYYENVDNKQRIKYRSAVLSANHQWVTRQPATLLSGSPWGIRSVTVKGTADSTGGTSSNNFVVMCTLY